MNICTSTPNLAPIATPVLSRETCELLDAAERLLKIQALLDMAAKGKLNWQQRRILREWASGVAQLAAALGRMARATEPKEGGPCQ